MALVMRYRRPTRSGARTSTTVAFEDASLSIRTDVRTARGKRAPAAVGTGPLRQPSFDGELSGDGAIEIAGHPGPVDDAVAGRGDPELVGRHALLVGVGLGAEHVEPVDRQHFGHPAEQSGTVRRHGGSRGRRRPERRCGAPP